MNKIKDQLKSNRGFTIQDLVFAIMILMIFIGVIAGMYISVYRMQADTQIDSIATIYGIKMLEYIDKISFDEVTESNKFKLINKMKEDFSIPDKFNVTLDIQKYTPEWYNKDYVRKVTLSIKYLTGDTESELKFNRIKVKEK